MIHKVAAARVQLSGCYLRYELVGYKQVPETQLVYKSCGTDQADDDGFEARRGSAFGMVTNGVAMMGKRMFYRGSYQSLNVMGQCEEDLASDDCRDCVKSAEDQAKDLCGDSISAHIYLHKCFFSYTFFPKHVSVISSSSSGSVEQQHTQKIVAIAVGVIAAIALLIVCLLCLKSVMKKREHEHWGVGALRIAL